MALSKSKANKASKVVKPRDGKRRTTVSNRQYSFQSFADRISSLKIDPIRRKRDKQDQDEPTDIRASYFARSLAKWREVNLSKTFTTFASPASALADNLPLVLHNQDEISRLLLEGIKTGDALALEPLTALLGDFARDLDTQFERHFASAVQAVTEIAAAHTDAAAIEWCFACLAWLFKYLSRLLVPDLRPVFELMAPYLGQQKHKPYIVRFAAESISFLLRKSATSPGRSDSLPLIINHILVSCEDASALYEQGIMTLLTVSMKGIQHDLHSAGIPIMTELLKQSSTAASPSRINIICGVLTSLIHFSTPDTFQKTFDIVMSTCEDDTTPVDLSVNMLFTITSVRKGARILQWDRLINCFSKMFSDNVLTETMELELRCSVAALFAVIICNCPKAPYILKSGCLDHAYSGLWGTYFLPLCDMVNRLDRSRWAMFLYRPFQTYIDLMGTPENRTLQVLPELFSDQAKLRLRVSTDATVDLRASLESLIASLPEVTDSTLFNPYLLLRALPSMEIDEEDRQEIRNDLATMVDKCLSSEVELAAETQELVFGLALKEWLSSADDAQLPTKTLLGLIRQSDRLAALPSIWTNMLTMFRKTKDVPHDEGILQTLKPVLLRNLTLPSHTIRQLTLEIIHELYRPHGPVPHLLDTALAIETTPISLATSRSISMNIRRLGAEYGAITNDAFLSAALPNYCLGLLHLRLAQAWTDAVDSIALMAKNLTAEETIMTTLQAWLQVAQTAHETAPLTPHLLNGDSATEHVSSDFECPNLNKMIAIKDQVFNFGDNSGRLQPDATLTAVVHSEPFLSVEARTQALKVLDKHRHMAEKRSRLLVPVLLQWTDLADRDDSSSLSERWSRKDQKALLAIFAKFTNPKVLYKSADVYNALLKLLQNGDVEIQRAALTAVLTWKQSNVLRVQQHLTNLLDDVKFREELSTFLQSDDEDGLRNSDTEEVMPILLRLLYGRLVGGAKDGQQVRRKAAFVALARFDDAVLQTFIDIATHAIKHISPVVKGHFNQEAAQQLNMPLRQQLGMLNMFDDMLDTIGSRLSTFAGQLLSSIMLCTVLASRQSYQQDATDMSLLRSVRQTGTQCIVKLYVSTANLIDASTSEIIRQELLYARLSLFVSENGQGISSILRLIAAWATMPTTAHLLWSGDQDILDAVSSLLKADVCRDEVRVFLLNEVIEPLLARGIVEQMPERDVSSLVDSITTLLARGQEKSILDACIRIVSGLAGTIVEAARANGILALCSTLLTQPSQVVAVRTKVNLLKTAIPLLQLEGIADQPELYKAMCGLFSRFSDIAARATLAEAFLQLCEGHSDELEAARICQDMNAMSTARLDQPDHEAQEKAFEQIFLQSQTMSARQWMPIMHNCFFLIRDDDDMVNRSSATKALKSMIAASAVAEDKSTLVQTDIFYTVQRGLTHKSEFVRAEYLSLLQSIIENLTDWREVSDMQSLLPRSDEDVSVLGDMLSIQQHKRLQALRRLGASNAISSLNISRLFLPLLEHFVFDQAPGDSGRTLADQAVQTIGQLARGMRWTHLRKTLSRLYAILKTKEDDDRITLRLIGVVVDGLVHVLQSSSDAQLIQDAKEADIADRPQIPENRTNIISKELLPPLLGFLHHKDESKVDRRVGVAISAVKLLRLLPHDEFVSKLAPALTDITHILRSRDLEARDQTRRALSTILRLIGPQYLGFMLKELRVALQRGYQLHVLSYTVHHLLVESDSFISAGELDEYLGELRTIIMDDIFGVVGIEKDSEEYRSNMKEIKAGKSYDTMEILARSASIARLGRLLKPLQAILCERLDNNMVKKVDNLLLRLQNGIEQNPGSHSRDMLTLCHELLRGAQDQDTARVRSDNYAVQKYVKRKASAGNPASATAFGYKITAFAFASLRRVLRKHEDLKTTQNLAAFLPLLGDALVSGVSEVKLEAAKVLSTILHVRLPALDDAISVYLKEAITMVKESRSTATDSARAGLELATAILRERRDAKVREGDVATLLRSIKTDLDQPGQQGQMFRFLRAVLGRKIVVTEVYDVMDDVAKSMVNNPDEGVRQNARAAYVQFIVDFPQSKERWTKTIGFLIKNMGFEHAGGRKSTLEAVHSLIGKLPDHIAQESLPALYLGLVPVLTSDSDRSCREMAALLIAQILSKSDNSVAGKIAELTMKWLGKTGGIHVAALECWTIIVRSDKRTKKDVAQLLKVLTSKLSQQQESGAKDYMAGLDLLLAICEVSAEQVFSSSMKTLWQAVGIMVADSTIQTQQRALAAFRLLFDDIARSLFANDRDSSSKRLVCSGGLEVTVADLRDMCLAHMRCLRNLAAEAEVLTEDLMRNLLFMGRVFVAKSASWSTTQDQNEASGSDSEHETADRDTSAFGYVFSRMSFTVRREDAHVLARTTALQTAGALLSIMPDASKQPQLLIRPLYVLTDSSIPQREELEYKALSDKAREVLDLIQKKVGSESYVEMLANARRAVIGKREERRQKRKIEAVSQPEKWVKDKRKKHDAKKIRSKEKSHANRAKRAIY